MRAKKKAGYPAFLSNRLLCRLTTVSRVKLVFSSNGVREALPRLDRVGSRAGRIRRCARTTDLCTVRFLARTHAQGVTSQFGCDIGADGHVDLARGGTNGQLGDVLANATASGGRAASTVGVGSTFTISIPRQ